MKYASSIMVTVFCVAYVLGVIATLNRTFPPVEKDKTETATASVVP